MAKQFYMAAVLKSMLLECLSHYLMHAKPKTEEIEQK